MNHFHFSRQACLYCILLQWLSNFAAIRHGKPCAKGSNSIGVVFVNRRILDQGGKRQNEAVASVVKDARACNGLLQLDPLDADDRYSYLCLSLKASWVPPEVSAWVSGIANGNPQYTEICAKALEKAQVLELKPVEEEGRLPRAEYKEGARALAKMGPPPKVRIRLHFYLLFMSKLISTSETMFAMQLFVSDRWVYSVDTWSSRARRALGHSSSVFVFKCSRHEQRSESGTH